MAKKKSSTSPTQRTIERLRADGWTCQSVEKKAPMPAGMVRDNRSGIMRMAFFLTVTQDLFGCIDILAIRPGDILGIQATSGGGIGLSNFNARKRKVESLENAKVWLQSGARLQIWSWKKVGHRWQPHIEDVTLEMFEKPF